MPGTLSAKLTNPLGLRDIFAALGAVHGDGIIHFETSTLTLTAANTQHSLIAHADLTFASIFEQESLEREFAVQLHYYSFCKMFRSFRSMSEVTMRIVLRGGSNGRLGVKMTSGFENPNAMVVSQKIYVRDVATSEVPQLNVSAADLYCELQLRQLAKISRVADRYKLMKPHVSVQITPDGILSVTCDPEGAKVSTSWTASVPELADGSFTSGSTATVRVKSKDWHTVVQQCQQLAARVVLGIQNDALLIVYCYLLAGQDDNVLTFYLSGNPS